MTWRYFRDAVIRCCRLTETRNSKGKGYRIVEEPLSKSRGLKNDERMNEEKAEESGRTRRAASRERLLQLVALESVMGWR